MIEYDQLIVLDNENKHFESTQINFNCLVLYNMTPML